MSVHVGVSGAWKELIAIGIGVSGSFKEVSAGYVGVSGAWKKIFGSNIPENLIALFDDTVPDPWNALENTGVFPIGAEEAGGDDLYASTHAHETSVANVFANSASLVSDDAIIRADIMGVHGSGHNYYHTHTSTSHEPANRSWRGGQANGAMAIPAGAILFFAGESIPTGWSRATYTADDYVKLDVAGTGAAGGSATHTHAHANATNTAVKRSHQVGQTYDRQVYASHSHTVPDHAAEPNNPPFITLEAITPDDDWSAEIPSDVVAFFVGSDVPDGWSVYSEALGRFVKLDGANVGATGGETSHSHALSETSGGYTGSPQKMGADGYTSTGRPHSHGVSHTHDATQDNSMPAAREFLICKKD